MTTMQQDDSSSEDEELISEMKLERILMKYDINYQQKMSTIYEESQMNYLSNVQNQIDGPAKVSLISN